MKNHIVRTALFSFGLVALLAGSESPCRDLPTRLSFPAAPRLLPNATLARADAPTEEDKKLLADVAAKLLAVCDVPEEFVWPPDIGFEAGDEINAYAGITRKDGKRYPIVRVTYVMMSRVINGKNKDGTSERDIYPADRLAFIVGHELGHIVKKHVIANPARDKNPLLKNTFGRNEEVEADLYGMQLALKAGYSLEKGIGAITRMQALGLDYSSFEGLGTDHPSWNDRLAKMDKDKTNLWKAMAAFSNGVLFLTTENYSPAIESFEKVTKEFPNSYAAWANLGYAQLMKYCDSMTADQVKGLGIGQVVTGGFYQRSKLDVRGDGKLWKKAVESLEKSNQLKVGQTIVLANLGLAQLINPDGKNVPQADKYLREAAKAAKDDSDLDPAAHAAILINLGVSTIAGGEPDKGLAELDEAEKKVRAFAAPNARRLAPAFDAAVLYSRAMILAGKKSEEDREKAITMLGQYLRSTSMYSLWWNTAYDRYAALCKAAGRAAKEKLAFKNEQPEPTRLITGVKLKKGTITLADEFDDVKKVFGVGKKSLAIQGKDLLRVRYEEEGVELLINDDAVIVIILSGPNAPPIALQGKMVGTEKVGELKIGMSFKEVEQLLGEDYQPCEIIETEVYYRFFRDQGVAVRVSKGKVVELVVVKIPLSREG